MMFFLAANFFHYRPGTRSGQGAGWRFWPGLLGRALEELVFPPRCLGCRAKLASSRPPLFCPACAEAVQLLAGPGCLCCGKPLPNAAPDATDQWGDSPPGDRFFSSHHCGACLSRPPRFSRARSIAIYDGPLAQAIQGFKYHQGLAGLATFAALAAASSALRDLTPPDLILPVPLHLRRLRQRGFNQALLLARALFPARVNVQQHRIFGRSARLAYPRYAAPGCLPEPAVLLNVYGPLNQRVIPKTRIAADLLERRRWTEPQTGMNGRQRRQNLKGAFAVTPGKAEQIKDKSILLVDDVFTTGSTVNECAKVLLAAGAREVQVLTLARVRE